MPSLFNLVQNNQFPVNSDISKSYALGKQNNKQQILQHLLANPDPQQAAMFMLQQQNPQMAQFIQQAMISGQSPQAVMQGLGISADALASIKSSFGR